MTSPRSAKWSRIPTATDIAAFAGMHCGAKYRHAVQTGWRCPCCDRSAHELIRWSFINGQWWREKFGDEHGMGWTISIVRHHCHGAGRFDATIICGDCNSADGAAKRKLKLPPTWSFTPAEIAQFVTCTPHSGRTLIDHDMAHRLYMEDTFR